MPTKQVETCGNCWHARHRLQDTLICRRNPPTAIVIDNKPMTIRVAVEPNDPACGEWQRNNK
jgi:hypothetical protein